VTSRYPLWDITHPERMAEVPHTKHGDERLGVAVGGGVGGHEVAVTHPNPANSNVEMAGARGHVEQGTRHKTAAELGIPMPNPSIMPLVCAAGVVCMFSGLLFLEKSTKLGVGIILFGALWWVSSLYNWLTTPLEDAH
jgi:cytochrome c oxidase subunit 1